MGDKITDLQPSTANYDESDEHKNLEVINDLFTIEKDKHKNHKENNKILNQHNKNNMSFMNIIERNFKKIKLAFFAAGIIVLISLRPVTNFIYSLGIQDKYTLLALKALIVFIICCIFVFMFY
jgi:hypothetical protein